MYFEMSANALTFVPAYPLIRQGCLVLDGSSGSPPSKDLGQAKIESCLHRHRVSHMVGSIEVGKLADIVLWKPAFFGVKPSMILKSGMIAAAQMGDPNASIPTPQPVHYRLMFGAFGGGLKTSFTFVSQAAYDAGIAEQLKLNKPVAAVKGMRKLRKADMIHNSYAPTMEVDAETYEVRADGELLVCEPADVLPMAQRYFLF